jgi:hypothetical protein
MMQELAQGIVDPRWVLLHLGLTRCCWRRRSWR